MKLSFFIATTQRLFLLFITLAVSCSAFAQANYLTVFGHPGTGCSTNYDINRMSSLNTPGGFTAMHKLTDPYIIIPPASDFSNFFQNSAYDKAGNLLFSVNIHGIYAPDGSQVFTFRTTQYYPVVCPDKEETYEIRLEPAVSEICIAPVSPTSCDKYYVIFWCAVHDNVAWGTPVNVLRCVEVDLQSSFGNSAVATSLWYTFQDKLLGKQPDCIGYMQNFVSVNEPNPGAFEVVVDEPNSDGSRDIYTAHFFDSLNSDYTQIRLWHIEPDGTLPTEFHQFPRMLEYPPQTTKAKIFKIGTEKHLAFTRCSRCSEGHQELPIEPDL